MVEYKHASGHSNLCHNAQICNSVWKQYRHNKMEFENALLYNYAQIWSHISPRGKVNTEGN